MTKEQVIAMAREAGCPDPMVFAVSYTRFTTLVRNAALEEAAQNLLRNADKCSLALEQSVLQCNANEIRNIKEPTP